MFPIRDHNPSEATPYVTYTLIAMNVAVYLYGLAFLSTNTHINVFYDTFGMIPARVSLGEGYATFISSTFLHAGFMQSQIVTVGASGAIAGVMGGYLLMFPKAKVDILLILIIIFRIIPVPAWIMLGLWFAIQLVQSLMSDPTLGGVAYWAHAGGFIIGLVLTIPVWLRRGGIRFWEATAGHPPHPEAKYKWVDSSVPVVRRR